MVIAVSLFTSTTTAGATLFSYDVPPIARVDAHQIEADAAGPIVLSNGSEESAGTVALAVAVAGG